MVHRSVPSDLRSGAPRVRARQGYCGLDIVGTCFRLAKFATELPEELKLDFIKEIGFCHMRVLEGLDTLLQLSGLVAKLCCQAQMKGARPPKKQRVE